MRLADDDRSILSLIDRLPLQSFAGNDPHPSWFDKAAMLHRGITQGHAFDNGNKRTGFLVAAFYLHNTGHGLPEFVPIREVIAFGFLVSAGHIRDLETIKRQVMHFWNVTPETVDQE